MNMRKSLRAALIGTTALTALMTITSANAAGPDSSPGQSAYYGISPDGAFVAGESNNETSFLAPTWWSTSGGFSFPAFLTAPGAVTAVTNGAGLVGWYEPASTSVAFYLAPGAFQVTNLPAVTPGASSQALGINADNTIAVGVSDGTAAFWTLSDTSIHQLLSLAGESEASGSANGVSDNGNIIVGQMTTVQNGHQQAVFWNNNGLAQQLPATVSNNSGSALAVSGDGSTAVGYSGTQATITSPVLSQTATRWTLAGGGNSTALSLGTLNGDQLSEALAVNHDGTVIVGWSGASTPLANDSTTLASASAFRWIAAQGMQPVQNLLVTAGVNMAGWNLSAATGVSADGTAIAGFGSFNGGASQGWFARVALPSTGNGGGTTPPPSSFLSLAVLDESLAGQSAIGQMGNSIIGGDLSTFNQYALQDHAHGNTPWSVFGYASYNSDPAGSGTVGITRDLPGSMIVGAAVSADYATSSMVFNGNATMQGGSGGAFLARIPDAGLQWFLGIDGTSLSGSVRRGYLNGSGPASSQGNTGVDGYGATARIGWTFNDVIANTRVTPFVSYTYTSAHVDGYTESGGPFPMQLDGFDSDQQTARVGADARYTFAPGQWLWGSAAWAHLVNGGNGPTISGQIIGLFGVSAPGITSAPDWAELTAGIRLPAWSNGAVTASVTASVPTDNEPVTYVARLGVSEAF